MEQPDFERLYFHYEDRQAVLYDTFTSMSFEEFNNFIDYCFQRMDIASEERNGGEFHRIKGLLIAVARKQLEIGYFMDGLSQEARDTALKSAHAIYVLAHGFYGPDQRASLDEAWASSIDTGNRFGYSTTTAEILAPHTVFRR